MTIVLIDDKSLPPPPHVGLRAPDDMETRRRLNKKKLVYGFPLPEEWFEYRFRHDLHIDTFDPELKEKAKDYYRATLVAHLIGLCDRMEDGGKCHPGSVQTSTVSCWFLAIGTPGNMPSLESVKKLRETLLPYGVVESPRWYPKIQ
ncbi:hypothetical protein HYPSUDRAFT_46633 [Hypholoma sublateritium FD-334 SS-4]|uniref:Uncharacterized protein n=1 Tax=Hypholoma sublateritium (strain FD-334 SS-4) TaxID=945553 RepID=A0A0D2PAF0_HYPSF|nr:hypothetical protein HYPSUDRAFT_46633 [Hypholoma sublateritium FD-334 SS-4]